MYISQLVTSTLGLFINANQYLNKSFFGLLVKRARFQKLFSEKNVAEKKSKKKTKENNAIRV